MKNLVIRWTIGESNSFRIGLQALEMLDYSIKFSKLIFNNHYNNANYYICYNNLNKKVKREVGNIAKKNNINAIDVSEMLPIELRNQNEKNSWWKFAPPRLDIKAYEIIMDNDVVIWALPDTLKNAIECKALVALEDGVGKFYSVFKDTIDNIDKNLKINAGLLGNPPGFEINLTEVTQNPPTDYFFSEQGYTALNFARYTGLKYLIPISEIQQLNANRIDPIDLISNYKGGHFCGCSYDIEIFWEKFYSSHIKKKYNEMINY